MHAPQGLFLTIVGLTVLQRLAEIVRARRNTQRLLRDGAVEFGRGHYPVIVLLHVLFFVSLLVEYRFHDSWLNVSALMLFLLAQAGRVWVLRIIGRRWTTRVLVIKGESLIRSGPFQWLSHPNYTIVAIELLTLPLAFGLWRTAILFTVLNALVLLGIRLPVERKALRWSQE